MPEPTVESLLSAEPFSDDRALAARAAPLLMFDAREPFLPSAVGYTVFRADGPSPSFPRQICLAPPGRAPAALAIEYAIWWDWDIGHLYELEHAWVYLDAAGQVVEAEASWHGGYHVMRADGDIPFRDGRVRLLSEPGKHALAPCQRWFETRRAETLEDCARPGKGGVWITPLFEAHIHDKSPAADRAVQAYLAQSAFEPTYEFTQPFQIAEQHLVAWPRLFAWIPRRVAGWVRDLAGQTG
ncbi:MAG: hypothetical protein AAGU78_10065 [Chloroflexota bacterium]|nr:hypothetical protein [Anaerolineae bacterium]HMM26777.1 hypothetical protein [Aggregatilineaceae bacterium]